MTQPGSLSKLVPPGKDARVKEMRELQRRLAQVEGKNAQLEARIAKLEAAS